MIVIMAIAVAQIVIMKNIDTLNPEHQTGGGSVSYTHVFEYAKEYTAAKTRRGSGGGRLSSTIIAFDTALEAGIGQMMLGFGAGSLTSSALDERRHFDRRIAKFAGSYGKTGLTYIFIEYGFLGVMSYPLGFHRIHGSKSQVVRAGE